VLGRRKSGVLRFRANVKSELTGINITILVSADDVMVVTIPGEVPMRVLALAILTVGMVSAAGQARAQTYDPDFPVCMHLIPMGGGSQEDCAYYTMAQCAMAASGRAGQCIPNPYYAGAVAAPEQSRRRNRRGY